MLLFFPVPAILPIFTVRLLPSIVTAPCHWCKRFLAGGRWRVGGGGEIYRQALPFADRVYLTLVHAEFDGDVFFPALPPEQFAIIATEEIAAAIPYTLSTFKRVMPDKTC